MTRIVLQGNYQSVSRKFIPPITDGLTYWGLFGFNAAFTIRNHGSGLSSAIIGSPVYHDNYATFLPGTNSLLTDAAQSASQTIVSIARPITDDNTFIASTETGPVVTPPPTTTRGATLRFEAGVAADGKVSVAYNQSIKDGSNVDQAMPATKTLASNVSAFTFVSGRCDSATGIRTVKDWNSGLSATATSAFPVNLGSNKFIVGGSPAANTALYQHAVDIAMVGIFSRALSDAEIAVIDDWRKAYCAVRGLV